MKPLSAANPRPVTRRRERVSTQPASSEDHRPGIAMRKPDGIARRLGARLLHEVHEALPPTIFFFIGFNFVVFTTNLLVAQYLVAVSNFMLATIAALVVGKAVLVANKIPLLRRYDRAPLRREGRLDEIG